MRAIIGVGIGVIGGILLLLVARRDSPGPGEAKKHPLSILVILLTLAAFSIWCVIASVRFSVPFELEWCGGTMREMTQAVINGRSLYPPVSSGWFPYEYPPLYFYISAAFSKIFHLEVYQAMRAVSITSTLGCCVVIFLWVVRLSRGFGAFWGAVAVGLLMASYRMSGAWFDIERIDMLFLLLSLMGAFVLTPALENSESEGKRQFCTIMSAILFSLAFLTKQQAILFAVGAFVVLLTTNRHLLAAKYLATFAFLSGSAVVIANQTTAGGFFYYCFKVPAGNGIQIALAKQFFITDLPLIAPILFLGIISLPLLARVQGNQERSLQSFHFGTMLFMAAIGSLLSRAHWGGDQNVLIPLFTFAIIWGCTAASSLEYRSRMFSLAVSLIIIGQFGVFAYKPQAQLPIQNQSIANESYAKAIKQLETEGDVLCLDHGGITANPHFHILSLLDVYHAAKGIPVTIVDAIHSHKYAAIVVDSESGISGLVPDISTYYPNKTKLGLTDSWTVTGYSTPSADRPVWVYRP